MSVDAQRVEATVNVRLRPGADRATLAVALGHAPNELLAADAIERGFSVGTAAPRPSPSQASMSEAGWCSCSYPAHCHPGKKGRCRMTLKREGSENIGVPSPPSMSVGDTFRPYACRIHGGSDGSADVPCSICSALAPPTEAGVHVLLPSGSWRTMTEEEKGRLYRASSARDETDRYVPDELTDARRLLTGRDRLASEASEASDG